MILETVFYNDNATGLRRKPFCMQQNGAAPFSIFFSASFSIDFRPVPGRRHQPEPFW